MLLLLAAIALGQPLHAPDWPKRPVRIVVPHAAGGITDDVAHVAAQRLADAFGQPFVLEHRPGAAGALATKAVVRSAADGYTLCSPACRRSPSGGDQVSFDPLKDLVPIAAIGTNALVLVVHPSLPVTSVAELRRICARPCLPCRVVSAKTPAAITRRLQDALAAMHDDPVYLESLARQGANAGELGAEPFVRLIKK